MKSFIHTAALAIVLLVPIVASAQVIQTTTNGYQWGIISNSGGFNGLGMSACTSAGIGCIANTILYLINSVFVPVLFAIAFIVFLYGVYKSYIYSHGEPAEVSAGHKLILWGIIGFVVMISLWGLVNIVANTFGLGGVGAPRPPVSYPY